jgi:putative transcriptional regulator
MDSLQGHLLLASPHLVDPNFVHTVVFLIQHNDEGALGVVLNRPTSKTVRELWEQVGETPCECGRPIYLGGPVSGPLMALHTRDGLAELEIVPGVYFAARKQNLDEIVRQDEECYRVFIGHAGWGPGQLESELEQGAWRSVPATASDIFDEADDLWLRLLRRAEGALLPEILHIKHVPPDPSMN